ncbi:MAG TPA: thioredoxin domain-containing protein [Novosphingobium sp.]
MPLDRSLRRLLGQLLALIVALGGLVALPAAAAPGPVLVVATGQGSHVVGRAAPAVKLVEYVSYTCPHCAEFEKLAGGRILVTVVSPGKASFEYRPVLRNILDVAATLMVNCGPPARFQGNHTMVLRNQAKWVIQPSEAQLQRWQNGDMPARLRAIAGDTGLYDMFERRGYSRVELDRCLADQKQVETIAKENEAAFAAGVQGTPSFFINGQLQDAHDWNTLKPALEAATK